MNSTNFKYLVFILFFLGCSGEQTMTYPEYYRAYNEIKDQIEVGEIDLAISNFENIFSKVQHIPSNDLFRIARACANNNDCKIAKKYLKVAIENGHEYGKASGQNKTIVNCSNEINQVLKSEADIHGKYFDYEYKELIDSMFKEDQKTRMESDYKKMRIIDSVNMEILLSKIENIGFPSEKLVGHITASRAFIIILHMDRDKNNKVFKPVLDKAYNDGFISPRSYAWIVDRRRAWGEDKLEPFYYQMPSKKFKTFNQNQIDEINKRRDSIGFERI